jgi:hypothetical protein
MSDRVDVATGFPFSSGNRFSNSASFSFAYAGSSRFLQIANFSVLLKARLFGISEEVES